MKTSTQNRQTGIGTTIINTLATKFPIISGCPREDHCKVCKNGNGVGCSGKNIVYQAECDICQANLIEENELCPIDLSDRGGDINTESDNTSSNCVKEVGYQSGRGGMLKTVNGLPFKEKQVHIGETSRNLRTRAKEHLDNLRLWRRDSFIIGIWFNRHKELFTFKQLRKFGDAFSRQLMEAILILEKGTLNSKLEFGINQICRLENSEVEWKSAEDSHIRWLERKESRKKLESFIVMKSELNCTQNESHIVTYPTKCSRYKDYSRDSRKRRILDCISDLSESGTKVRKMNASTPVQRNAPRKAGTQGPDLESPISVIMGMTTTQERLDINTSTLSILSGTNECLSKNMKTNISNELRSSKIGSRSRENDSSLDFTIGASCFVDESGARIIKTEDDDDQFQSETGGVDVDTWNSASSFPGGNSDIENVGNDLP